MPFKDSAYILHWIKITHIFSWPISTGAFPGYAKMGACFPYAYTKVAGFRSPLASPPLYIQKLAFSSITQSRGCNCNENQRFAVIGAFSHAQSQKSGAQNKKKIGNLRVKISNLLYPEPGSNRHGLPHWCLRPARLPIPPSGLVVFAH